MNPRHWYTLKAQEGGDSAELLLYDDIGQNWYGEGIGAQQLIEDLANIEASTIDVRINSAGGLVFEGLAIYNALVRHSARIVTHVDGIAASISSIIALAGDEVRIAENAFLMVHRAWGVVVGNAIDMRATADVLEKLDDGLAQTYASKSGKTQAQARKWMDGETWFSATDAKEQGLADVIEGKREEKAAFNLSEYRHVPDQVAARFGGAPPPPKAEQRRPIVLDLREALAAVSEMPKREEPAPANDRDELAILRMRSERHAAAQLRHGTAH